MKIAYFDFCDTIVNFQTADAYVSYTAHQIGLKRWFDEVLEDARFKEFFDDHWRIKKELILMQLKGCNRNTLIEMARNFYSCQIMPQLNKPVVDMVDYYKQNNYEVYIVSSGYSIYIDFFASDHKVDRVIANDFLYDGKGLFTGKIIGEDCSGEEKINRIRDFVSPNVITDSISVSDSISDMPLLRYAKKSIVVSKKTYRKWPMENGFDQMVLADYIE